MSVDQELAVLREELQGRSLSEDFLRGLAQLRYELHEANAIHETVYAFNLGESQVIDLAAGLVPDSLRAMFRWMLEFTEEDNRRAAAREAQSKRKPTRKAKR